MRRGAWLLPLLLLGAGCAYYNGMYNAKRLASRARKAERDGRTFDAGSLWGQVSVKAESVLVRHPDSKWADEARLLQGTARVKLRDCAGALPLLEQVMLTTANPEFAEQAALQVGGCRVQLGDPTGASAAYARLLASPDPSRRNLALFAHGRALRLAGEPGAALAELSQTDDRRARGERAAALAALGRLAEAQATADSLLADADSLAPWEAILAGFAGHDLAAAEVLLPQVLARDRFPAGLRARLLDQHALRLEPIDTIRSNERFHQALAIGDPAMEAEIRLHHANAVLRRAVTLDDLRRLGEELDALDEPQGPYGPPLAQLRERVRRFRITADSTPPGTPRGDLRLFVAGELARDSLDAPRLAGTQFRRVAEGWPASPFAPKALLAAVALEPDDADSLRALLRERYPESPYLRLAEGADAADLTVLEDSLRRFATSFRPEGGRRVTPRPGAPGQQPATPREPADR